MCVLTIREGNNPFTVCTVKAGLTYGANLSATCIFTASYISHGLSYNMHTMSSKRKYPKTHMIIGDSSDCLKPPHNSIPNSAYARAYLSPWNISFTRALLEQSILGWSEVTHEPGTKRTHLFPAIRPWGTQFNALIGAISELSISTIVSTLTA